ncbi:PadR family transcriptional regulator [Nocardiopsis suaedae]|uniref:PadR family transcriptional regulator n=1 Tax=Nocardiopsis suaedae TaxID=3018444 RepID=A0ABT4TQL1_9ACTN|nr:PadR family transcriptional regulator [Nocardiopsis suaedae]MDA2806539.1 PadR family transcriptional regulator [Nocardiopsis suaedae]
MSLPHALLGLLATEPRSGYELSKELAEGPVGRFAWKAGHTSVYPELNRLLGKGLIADRGEGPRGRRTYAITDAGRRELRSWLMDDPVGPSKMRNEPVLRMFLLSVLDPDDAITVLRRVIDHVDTEAAELRRARAPYGDTVPPGPEGFGHIAAEFGVRVDQTVREWALWAIDQLSRHRSTP